MFLEINTSRHSAAALLLLLSRRSAASGRSAFLPALTATNPGCLLTTSSARSGTTCAAQSSERIFSMTESGVDPVVPKLVVFDCDMCLWEPELFQLSAPPSGLDEATNTVVAGSDRLKLFEGALLALRQLNTEERFSGTQVAVASSTSRTEWALECLRLLQISDGVSAGDVIKYREIYSDNKGRHFKSLHKDSGIAYSDMLFFDDCNWGDNCRDVEWACPGVVTTKTPDGLTPEKWAEGLAKFAETKR